MSLINPNNINGGFPVFGQDNPTQGFRDNFTNIKNNLTFAKQEIEDLQNKAILKSALTGTDLNNESLSISGSFGTGGAISDMGYQYIETPSTGFAENILTNKSKVIIDPSATLAAGNVTLPNVSVDGTIISIHSSETITAFGANTAQSGTAIKPDSGYTLAAGSGVTYMYLAQKNIWYKLF
jgi:hypothetical protein